MCPETWPNWKGKLSDGVAILVKHLGYKPEDYKLGRSLTHTDTHGQMRKQNGHTICIKLSQSDWARYIKVCINMLNTLLIKLHFADQKFSSVSPRPYLPRRRPSRRGSIVLVRDSFTTYTICTYILMVFLKAFSCSSCLWPCFFEKATDEKIRVACNN